MPFKEAVDIREKMIFHGDKLQSLKQQYIAKSGKADSFQCKACQMFVIDNSMPSVIKHFAFYHTEEMQKMMGD
ncbi:hypothetical protein CYMTET_41367 [Cymbomonas tetramitiformis]|uniref:Uncharacterized protein n=1 Tax=Cymbomonas tetramitiformis TaxID=36881 RepID=A0AAE0C7A9_9CHLO|nr:hypothetical protein CYMTET_41367 [Cymbomonas tetramitiformis]|eukprot:gene10103-11958_t